MYRTIISDQFTEHDTVLYQIGHLISAAGGTRVNNTKLIERSLVGNDRPWQSHTTLPPYSSSCECPFEKNTQINQVKKTFGSVTLRRFENPQTPFRRGKHHLIIPDIYNPDHTNLTELYGEDHITATLSFAIETIISGKYTYPVQLNVHIGLTAGQRIHWLHWHLIECIGDPMRLAACHTLLNTISEDLCFPDNDFLILQNNGFSVFAAGSRSGSLFITTQSPHLRDGDRIGEFLYSFIKLCNGAFLSKQSMSPEYSLNLMFSPLGNFQLGFYVPILNFQGGTEYWAQLLNLAEIMPIKHEETAALLRTYIATHGF